MIWYVVVERGLKLGRPDSCGIGGSKRCMPCYRSLMAATANRMPHTHSSCTLPHAAVRTMPLFAPKGAAGTYRRLADKSSTKRTSAI